MKMKEKSLYELNNNIILLESRCQQLEARNFELEQTVKLLKRQIQANDCPCVGVVVDDFQRCFYVPERV
jgi:hypothetical protein